MDGGGGDHVTAGQHLLDLAETPGILFRDHPEQPRRQLDGRDLAIADERAQCFGIDLLVGRYDDSAAGEQGDPDLVVGGVEGVRGVHQHPLVCGVGP